MCAVVPHVFIHCCSLGRCSLVLCSAWPGELVSRALTNHVVLRVLCSMSAADKQCCGLQTVAASLAAAGYQEAGCVCVCVCVWGGVAGGVG
jgi:hypothetical protein